jgi:hypothetical protein
MDQHLALVSDELVFQSVPGSVRGSPNRGITLPDLPRRGLARVAGHVHPNGPVDLVRGVGLPGGVQAPHALSLLGGLERLELGEGAAKPDLARRSIDEVNRNEPPRATPVRVVDGEMGDLPGDRSDDDAADLTAGTIGAPGVGADPQRHHLRHPLVSLDLGASPASGAVEVPGRGQPHLGEHSPGQW